MASPGGCYLQAQKVQAASRAATAADIPRQTHRQDQLLEMLNFGLPTKEGSALGAGLGGDLAFQMCL